MGKINNIEKSIAEAKILMPSFPSTRYFSNNDFGNWIGEEKLDGANMGAMFHNNELYIRNRNHVLRKGYIKDTPAKKQFIHAWNWLAENKKSFSKLNSMFEEDVVVYGEWCYALHGVKYTKLPDYFVAFDIYLPSKRNFVSSLNSRKAFNKVNLSTSPIIFEGELNKQVLEKLSLENSCFSNEPREGIYLKKNDDFVIDRIKFVREDYKQNENWSYENLTKQTIDKG